MLAPRLLRALRQRSLQACFALCANARFTLDAQFDHASRATTPVPRACVAGEVLDYDTVAGSDKFGNMFVLRLPSDVGDADGRSLHQRRLPLK